MGVKLKDLIVKEEIEIKSLANKILVVDAMNILYQFLTTIRAYDGSVLTNSKGIVTSHLIGLFSRTSTLMEHGLKLAFVFDGKAPLIKQKTWEQRTSIKAKAEEQLIIAKEEEDFKSMKKFAARTAILTKEMQEDAKKLILALGLPIIDAPSEGEAQASYIVSIGDAYGVVSQDYDTLMFGCTRLIRNLSIAGNRKRTGKVGFVKIKPEIVKLKDFLKHNKITREQLIAMGIMIGTDYNPGGIKGIGPKKALKLVQENTIEEAFKKIGWDKHYPDLKWKEIYDVIIKMPTTDNYKLEWNPIDTNKLYNLLVNEFEFSKERVESKIKSLKKQNVQKGLNSFF